jgi:HAD superfamily hydrolase (TIGR01459 family)
MGPMRSLSGFAPLADLFDGFIIDLWGVVHDGVDALPGAADCLARLRDTGKPAIMLSNAPRRSFALQAQLRSMGIDDGHYSAIVSSGEAVHQALRNPPDGWWAGLGTRVFHLGPLRDRNIIDGLDLTVVATPGAADFVLNTGPDDHLDPTDLDAFVPILRACHEVGLRMICANPDLEVIRGSKRVLCAGTLARLYASWGGDVRSLGKPDPAIYGPVISSLGVPADRTLAVGDALRTDIAGAQAAGLASCWVLGGLHDESLRAHASAAATAAKDAGLTPFASIPRFVW